MATMPSIADFEEDNDSPYFVWEVSDAMVRELMEAGDIEGAKTEFGKTLLQSLDSGAFQSAFPLTVDSLAKSAGQSAF